jgi:hypothetical protein
MTTVTSPSTNRPDAFFAAGSRRRRRGHCRRGRAPGRGPAGKAAWCTIMSLEIGSMKTPVVEDDGAHVAAEEGEAGIAESGMRSLVEPVPP